MSYVKPIVGMVTFGEVNTPFERLQIKHDEAVRDLGALDIELIDAGIVIDDPAYETADTAIARLKGKEFSSLIVCVAGWVPTHAVVRVTDRPEPGAKPIETGYETLESGPVSRLRVHLITGRTHQIRAHLAALGHPVLGDDLYGDRDFNRREKARTLKLCAVSLKLDTGGRLPALDGKTFSIDPPF